MLEDVNVRNLQTCENFYEFTWAKLTIAGKQNLNGQRTYPTEWKFCTLFYTSQSQEEA